SLRLDPLLGASSPPGLSNHCDLDSPACSGIRRKLQTQSLASAIDGGVGQSARWLHVGITADRGGRTRGDYRFGGGRTPKRHHPMDTFRDRFAAGRLHYAIRLRMSIADVSPLKSGRDSAEYRRIAANEPLCRFRSGVSVTLSPSFGVDFRREDRDRSR